jgi:peptidoglycan-associated lipoprotein
MKMGRWAGGAVTVLVGLALVGAGCWSQKPVDLTEESATSGMAGESAASDSGGSHSEQECRGVGSAGPSGHILRIRCFDLDSEARALQKNAEWLKENGGARVELEGHCDERGTIEYNLALGARRAASAKAYLTALGVGADRLNTISYGEELPLCHDSSDACWQQNRRVHAVLIGE